MNSFCIEIDEMKNKFQKRNGEDIRQVLFGSKVKSIDQRSKPFRTRKKLNKMKDHE